MKKLKLLPVLILLLLAFVTSFLFACTPPEEAWTNPYPIVDDEVNEQFKDKTTKDQAIDRATDSLDNLLDYLDTEEGATTGYYMGADLLINAKDEQGMDSAFRLKLQANMYTYPYEQYEEGTPEYEAALAKHNKEIKKSDMVIEWYDGMTNTMLVGFYFDGFNDTDGTGNDLFLNLQGTKRIFREFGDSVLYQQLVRLLTHMNLETLINSATGSGSGDESVNSLRGVLDLAVSDNYQQTLNGDVASILFDKVSLNTIVDDLTSYMHSIFGPFKDKLDPLTNKYLGFLFSSLGKDDEKGTETSITALTSDIQFIMEPNVRAGKEILTELVLAGEGTSMRSYLDSYDEVQYKNIPFTFEMSADYDIQVSDKIRIDTEGYTDYVYGSYEFTGDMFIPALDLKLDVLLRTDMHEYDNPSNKVYMACRDIATDDLIIGLYYKDELTYVDIKGFQDLYGGIKFEDIGLPQAYKAGFDLADTLDWLFSFVDQYIVIAVDNILEGNNGDEESKFGATTEKIMEKVTSTMKDENDPSSRATIRVRVDKQLIVDVVSMNSKTGVNYSDEQIIEIINKQFNIDIETIADIMGVSVTELMNTTYFDITYDVDEYSIKLEVFSWAEMSSIEEASMVMRMNLYPQHIGEKVKIAFPDFSNFNELQDVMTYSGYMKGNFIFANNEEVDLSELLGCFMDDSTGLNTPYVLPSSAEILFELYYDQYIREQILENGRWTRRSRSAFNLSLYVVEDDKTTKIANVYANDVSLNTADPIEELGYIWLDYVCIEDMPKFKIREDLFVKSFYEYMGYDFETEDEDIVMGLTDIVKALMEDSWAVFEPEVIRVTTSNQTIKDFFRVEELIGNVEVKIGFKQRVKNIDHLEREFAMYTVDEFIDLEGTSIYDVKLHDTINVIFDWGERVENKDFLIEYDPASIAVTSGTDTYRPTLLDTFMGVNRDYRVYLTTYLGTQVIRELVEDRYFWEPLDEIPETVAAYYGDVQNMQADYPAEYIMHGVYDRNTDYYTVVNEFGYEILYDMNNEIYIVGLGAQYQYDKALEFLGNTAKIYTRTYKDEFNNTMRYDISSRIPGYYVVENIDYEVLYSLDLNIFVVKDIATKAAVTSLLPEGATIRAYTRDFESKTFQLDLRTGRYFYRETEIVDGKEEVKFRIVKDEGDANFRVSEGDKAAANEAGFKNTNLNVDASLIWDAKPYNQVDWNGENYDKVDWNDTAWDTVDFQQMRWEDLTLEGGIFLVQVVIGKGKMATYTENVRVKVWNRTVDTDKIVNINTESGSVKAPVAMTVDVDPMVYLLYKSYFVNTLGGNPEEFTRWFFNQYTVTIKFTDIYHDETEDTPDEVGFFDWAFDFDNEEKIYGEKQINNRIFLEEGVPVDSLTYVYTVFHHQVIALCLRVLPRELDYVMIDGETEKNHYTIDALSPEYDEYGKAHYYIPTNLVYYFKDYNGGEYTLDFRDFGASTIFSTLPETMSPIGNVIGADNGFSVIIWNDKEADNVKIFDNNYPFLSTESNVTQSAFDIKRHVDPVGAWYYEDWMVVPEITLTVEVPDKIINAFDKNFITEDHVNRNYALFNVQYPEYYVEGQAEYNNCGVYYVDPYNSDTWIMDKMLYVFFTNKDGTYTRYEYQMEWENLLGDTTEHFVQENGKLRFIDVTQMPRAYYLTATIGDEEVNYIEVRILIVNMSGVASTIEFTNADGSSLKNAKGDELTITGASGTHADSLQETLYTYNVDTYARFDIPELVRVTFKDGTTRVYGTQWEDHAPWVQGTSVDVATKIGDKDAINTKLYLNYAIEGKELNRLDVNNFHGNSENLSIDILAKTIVLDGIAVGSMGGLNSVIMADTPDGGFKVFYNPYEYFTWLFSDLTVGFAGVGVEDINITDATSSAYEYIFATLDTQEMIELLGQGIDIYVGQEDDAHDFKVIVKIEKTDSIEVDDTKPHIGGRFNEVSIQIYTSDNTDAYPNGYIISENLSFVVYYKDGRQIFYTPNPINGYNATTRPVPTEWAVTTRPEFTGSEIGVDKDTWMAGYEEYDIIDRVSMDSLYGGGVLWITTMLEDSTRVYVLLQSPGRSIGNEFYSTPDSMFKVDNGILIIDDIYNFYRLGAYLIPRNLPSKLILKGGYEISGIEWEIIASGSTLNDIDHKGTTSDIDLATATILKEKVTLKLRVLPSVINQMFYKDEQVDQSRWINSYEKDADGVLKVDIDPYANYAYYGDFEIPKKMTAVYETGVEHVFTGCEYYLRDDSNTRIADIEYDLQGHKLVVNGTTIPNERDVELKAVLPDGQVINILLHFNEKVITGYTVPGINDGPTDTPSKLVTIDPYGDTLSISQIITIAFSEGPSLKYTVPEWTIPLDFEVKYDTYYRLLATRADKYFEYRGELKGYVGLAPQEIDMKVSVLDRVLREWKADGVHEDTYTDANHMTVPNALYHYENPFLSKASDLPQVLEDTLYGNPQGLNIIWEFTDEQINCAGTGNGMDGKSYVVVNGFIDNVNNGQPIAIKVYVDRWEFSNIRKKQGSEYQSILNDIRFFFSDVTGKSSYMDYQIAFTRYNTLPAVGEDVISYVNQIFIPNDIDPTTLGYPEDYAYRIIWDAEAVLMAGVNGEVTNRRFTLGNAKLEVKLAPSNAATYQVERPIVTEIDLGYGYGVENHAIYVVNPLSPIFNVNNIGSMTLPVKAKGAYNLEYNVELDNPDLIIEVIWDVNGTTPSIPAAYLKGGVIRDWRVIVRIRKHSDPNYRHQQFFDIMLVCLDMSPTTYITSENISYLNSAKIKTTYNASTYMNTKNPYDDAYNEVLLKTFVEHEGVTDNALNTAVKIYGLQNARYNYRVVTWADRIYHNNNMKTQYSSIVEINGREYQTDIVKRCYSTVYEITSVDLGYGMGIDAAKYDKLVSEAENGVISQKKTRFVVNPFSINFGKSGTVVSKYVTELSKEKIVGSYNGTAFGDEYTFTVTWWDELNNGALTFEDKYVRGGAINQWKVLISVIKDSEAVYTEVYNIELLFLDMTPETNVIYSQTDYVIASEVKDMYSKDDYATDANPYGDSYTQEVIDALNSAIVHFGMATTEYNYIVEDWSGEEAIEGGYQQKSVRIRVTVNGETTEFLADGLIIRKYN